MAGPSGSTPILGLPYPTPDDNVDVPRDIKALADAIEGGGGAGSPGLIFVGEVRWIAVNTAPAGWLACDGAARSRSTYSRLFAAIGAVFGAGDGSTTFNVPDLRGRASVGAGQGAGLTARAIGTKWGVEAVALSTAQMPSHSHGGATGGASRSLNHSHGVTGDRNTAGGYAPTNLATGGVVGAFVTDGVLYNDDLNHGHALLADGGNAAHDNTQPSIAIPAYIYAGA